MDLDPRIRATFQEHAGFDFLETGVVLARVGSHSHGTYIPPTDPQAIDDVDYMGIFVPPPSHTLGLQELEHVVFKQDELDVVCYSLRKAFRLLLKSNPNVLGLLWLQPEHYVWEHPTHAWQPVLGIRDAFSSLAAYDAFVGYASSQFRKMTHFDAGLMDLYENYQGLVTKAGVPPETVISASEDKLQALAAHHATAKTGSEAQLYDVFKAYRRLHRKHFSGYMGDKRKGLVRKYGYDCKNASHLIRLMRMCNEFLESGHLNVYREHDAEYLIDIKQGKLPLEEVQEEAKRLFEEAETLRLISPLPPEPDAVTAEQLCVALHLNRYWQLV